MHVSTSTILSLSLSLSLSLVILSLFTSEHHAHVLLHSLERAVLV